MAKDYYKTLGVAKNAPAEDVKRAYRKLANIHHPDKPTGNEEKFKTIQEAYSILGNAAKRAEYDATYRPERTGAAAGPARSAPLSETFNAISVDNFRTRLNAMIKAHLTPFEKLYFNMLVKRNMKTMQMLEMSAADFDNKQPLDWHLRKLEGNAMLFKSGTMNFATTDAISFVLTQDNAKSAFFRKKITPLGVEAYRQCNTHRFRRG